MLVRMLRAAYAVPFKPGILDNPLRCGQISIKPVRQKPPSGFSLKKIRAFMSPTVFAATYRVKLATMGYAGRSLLPKGNRLIGQGRSAGQYSLNGETVRQTSHFIHLLNT
jgi:hypothetical protein